MERRGGKYLYLIIVISHSTFNASHVHDCQKTPLNTILHDVLLIVSDPRTKRTLIEGVGIVLRESNER